jgi:hypothetical protein
LQNIIRWLRQEDSSGQQIYNLVPLDSSWLVALDLVESTVFNNAKWNGPENWQQHTGEAIVAMKKSGRRDGGYGGGRRSSGDSFGETPSDEHEAGRDGDDSEAPLSLTTTTLSALAGEFQPTLHKTTQLVQPQQATVFTCQVPGIIQEESYLQNTFLDRYLSELFEVEEAVFWKQSVDEMSRHLRVVFEEKEEKRMAEEAKLAENDNGDEKAPGNAGTAGATAVTSPHLEEATSQWDTVFQEEADRFNHEHNPQEMYTPSRVVRDYDGSPQRAYYEEYWLEGRTYVGAILAESVMAEANEWVTTIENAVDERVDAIVAASSGDTNSIGSKIISSLKSSLKSELKRQLMFRDPRLFQSLVENALNSDSFEEKDSNQKDLERGTQALRVHKNVLIQSLLSMSQAESDISQLLFLADSADRADGMTNDDNKGSDVGYYDVGDSLAAADKNGSGGSSESSVDNAELKDLLEFHRLGDAVEVAAESEADIQFKKAMRNEGQVVTSQSASLTVTNTNNWRLLKTQQSQIFTNLLTKLILHSPILSSPLSQPRTENLNADPAYVLHPTNAMPVVRRHCLLYSDRMFHKIMIALGTITPPCVREMLHEVKLILMRWWKGHRFYGAEERVKTGMLEKITELEDMIIEMKEGSSNSGSDSGSDSGKSIPHQNAINALSAEVESIKGQLRGGMRPHEVSQNLISHFFRTEKLKEKMKDERAYQESMSANVGSKNGKKSNVKTQKNGKGFETLDEELEAEQLMIDNLDVRGNILSPKDLSLEKKHRLEVPINVKNRDDSFGDESGSESDSESAAVASKFTSYNAPIFQNFVGHWKSGFLNLWRNGDLYGDYPWSDDNDLKLFTSAPLEVEQDMPCTWVRETNNMIDISEKLKKSEIFFNHEISL